MRRSVLLSQRLISGLIVLTSSSVTAITIRQRHPKGCEPCRRPQRRRRRTAPGDRRSRPISSSRNPSRYLRFVSTAGMSIGWKDDRRSRVARSSCGRAVAGGEDADINSRAVQCAHTRARIWWRRLDGGAGNSLLLQFRGWPALSADRRHRRAAAADRHAISARRLAVCRRHHRSTPQPMDRRARGPHSRRRAGQRDRCGGSGASGRRARAHAGRRPRFLFVATFVARWTTAHLARLGPPQHAVERHHPVSRRTGRRRCRRRRAVSDCGRPGGIDLSTRVVARWHPHLLRVRPVGLVEPAPLRACDTSAAPDRADGGGVRTAAMGFRHVHLCLRRGRSRRLHLFPGRARETGGD